MNEVDIQNIQETVEEFFQKMTVADVSVKVLLSMASAKENEAQELVSIDIAMSHEPQFFIGQNGQTLSELQRVLRMLLNKKLGKSFYVAVDINEYRKKKVEYVKNLARAMADEVAFTKEKRVLAPMSSYERMMVHSELSQRKDVVTESQGDGLERYVVITPVF